jgi:hypothetical protein
VSNNDIAFRYELPIWDKTLACVVEKEETGFKFPGGTTTFLSLMMDPTSGWSRTTPRQYQRHQATFTAVNEN